MPRFHLCFSGDPTCSGIVPCDMCRQATRDLVMPFAMAPAGFAGSIEQAHRFFQGLQQATQGLHYRMQTDLAPYVVATPVGGPEAPGLGEAHAQLTQDYGALRELCDRQQAELATLRGMRAPVPVSPVPAASPQASPASPEGSAEPSRPAGSSAALPPVVLGNVLHVPQAVPEQAVLPGIAPMDGDTVQAILGDRGEWRGPGEPASGTSAHLAREAARAPLPVDPLADILGSVTAAPPQATPGTNGASVHASPNGQAYRAGTEPPETDPA